MNVPQDWMPPDMPSEDQDAYADLFPEDPHRAAAEAWGAWAATLTATPAVSSVSTGDQTVQYASGASSYDAAMQRANWHASRAKVLSVPLASRPGIAVRDVYDVPGEYGLCRDPLDYGTINTFISPTIPPTDPVVGVVVP